MNKSPIISVSRQRILVALFLGGILLAPAIMFLLVRRFAVNVPFGDEWEFPLRLVQLNMGELTLVDFFWGQHNEHRIVFPRLITFALAYLTGYNVVAQMYVGFVLKLLSLLFIWKLLQITLRQTQAALISPLTILTSLLLFSAAEVENWTWGFNALIWSLTVSCAIATVWTLARWPARWSGTLAAFLWTFVGVLTLAGNLTLWGVDLLGILAYSLTQSKKVQWLHVALWIVAAIVVPTVYFTDYHHPSYHPDLLLFLTHPIDFGIFIPAYLGTPLSLGTGYQSAAAVGFLGLVGLGAAVYWLVRYSAKMIKSIIPWLLLVSFALSNAIITAIGRVGFGLEHATSSRYTAVSTLFWIGAFAVIAVAVRQDFRQNLAPVRLGDMFIAALVATLLSGGYVCSYVRGYRALEARSYRLASALTYLYDYEMAPDEVLQTLYPPGASYLRERARAMESLKLGPFSNQISTRHLRLYAEPVIPAEVAMGELAQGKEVSQTFVSRCKELSRFDLYLATNERVNAQPVTVHLTDVTTDQLVYEQTIPISETSDNAWRQFLFEPLSDSALKTYRISLLSPDSQPGESLIIWRSQSDAYPGGEAFVNGSPVNADLAFRYGCAPLSAGSTNWLDLGPGFRPEMITRKTFTINGQAKDVIFAHPPASIAWPVILPENKTIALETFVALDPRVWPEPTSDGVVFHVYVETADNTVTHVFSRHVDPHNHEQDRCWIPVRIDLSQYVGQAITMRLETDFGPAGDPNYDWAVWGSPVLTVFQ